MNAVARSRLARSTRPALGAPPQALDMRPHAARAAALLKALGNPQRLMILCNLSGGELTVGELISRLPLSQSATSQHLAVLREQGLVATRREAQTIHYSLRPGPAAAVIATLHDSYCSSAASPADGETGRPRAASGSTASRATGRR
jgi:DNA-binding transcriptional ArsR family regulator